MMTVPKGEPREEKCAHHQPRRSAGAEIIRRRRTAVHSRLTIRDILFPNDADCA